MGGDWKEMFYAAQDGNLELVRYHVRTGVDLNYRHPEFLTTALIVCTENGHTHIAEYLLEQGADPYLKDGFSGKNAFEVAKIYKRKPITKLLKSYAS